jgi:fucose permease
VSGKSRVGLDRTERRRIGIAFSSFLVFGMPGALLNVAWSPAIRSTFQLPLDAVGTMLLASTAGYVLASALSGRLTAGLPLGGLFAASTLMSGVGMLASALAPAWAALVLASFVVGAGGGLLDGTMNIYFAANFGPRLMNWLHACFGIGATVAPLLMTAILERGGSWRLGDGLVALLFGALAVVFMATAGEWRQGTSGATERHPVAAPAWETMRLPAVWLGVGFFLACTGAEVSAGQWAFSLLTDARQVPGAIAGLWVSLYWGSFTAGRILFGTVADRVDPVALIRGCLVGMALGALLLRWKALGMGAALGLLLYGLSLAPMFALMITRTGERLGFRHAPNAIGFQVAAAGVGAAVLPGLAGVLAKRFGLEIMPGFLLAASLLMTLLFEAGQRRR